LAPNLAACILSMVVIYGGALSRVHDLTEWLVR
jgi:hypothetical protein